MAIDPAADREDVEPDLYPQLPEDPGAEDDLPRRDDDDERIVDVDPEDGAWHEP